MFSLCSTSTPQMDGYPYKMKRARMVDNPGRSKSAGQTFDLRDIQQRPEGEDHLTWVSKFVRTRKGKTFPLKRPAGATLRIGDKDDTIYKGKDNVVEGWGEFYLSEIVSMQVLGVVEGIMCLCEQLVLMTCEDTKLYAYDGEELHEVALSLEQLCDEGIKYPAPKSYYKGEAFEDMTEEEWDEVRKSPAWKRLDEKHHKLMMSLQPSFLENLSKHTKGAVWAKEGTPTQSLKHASSIPSSATSRLHQPNPSITT